MYVVNNMYPNFIGVYIRTAKLIIKVSQFRLCLCVYVWRRELNSLPLMLDHNSEYSGKDRVKLEV